MEPDNSRSLYLDLIKRCLTNSIYGDPDWKVLGQQSGWGSRISAFLAARNIQIIRAIPFDAEARAEGLDWPQQAHTMIGQKRLDNLQFCVEQALAQNIPGDFLEAGVWRGGAAILMRAVLKAHGVTDRCVWVADSFAGLPPPREEAYPQDRSDQHHTRPELAVSLAQVQSNFNRYGLLDAQVCFLPGWFRDTLPQAPVEKLAVVRLDGDMYESTMDGLTHLYPKLSPGGFLIVDDYGSLAPCRQAVDDYRAANTIIEEITPIDQTGVYWQRKGPG